MTSLKIAVADDEPDMRDFYRRMLTVLGHQVVIAAENGRALVASCQALRPELVLSDIVMPEMDGIEAALEIWQAAPLPVIIASARFDAEVTRRLETAPVMAYLVKPIGRRQLGPAIELALLRFDHFQRLHDEAADLSQALLDRQIVERAKRLLSEEAGVNEAGAFDRLQKTATASNYKIVDAARFVLSSGDFLA